MYMYIHTLTIVHDGNDCPPEEHIRGSRAKGVYDIKTEGLKVLVCVGQFSRHGDHHIGRGLDPLEGECIGDHKVHSS